LQVSKAFLAKACQANPSTRVARVLSESLARSRVG
jgi:hypothetical protein